MDRLDASDPQRIGPYTLLGRLGIGGMGAVYLGRSSGGRTVAVKVVRPELAGDAAFRDRFRAEVSAARAVSGAFTAPVVDADTEAATPWMATAFVAGVPLSQAIATRGPLPEISLWMLAAGVAEALADIHRAMLIHRDLKPSNILLAPDGPHVIDFGITRAMDGASPLTATGAVIGSPGYMSPEQVLGQPVGPETDMFSLGATLVYAATARGAYGEGATPALMFRVANSEPDAAALAAVPASLRDAVTACLNRDPARRPTPRQLADYVDQNTPVAAGGSWLPPALTADVVGAGAVVIGDATGPGVGVGGPGSGSGTGATTMVGISAPPPWNSGPYAATAQSGVGSAPSGGPGRRNLLLAAGGAVVLVGAGAGVVAMASGGGGTPKPDPTTPKTSPTSTGPTSPGPNPSTNPTAPDSPTTTLPPAAGSTGTIAGPSAKAAWTATLSEESQRLTRSGNVLVNAGYNGYTGYDAANGKSKWAKEVPVQNGNYAMYADSATVYVGGGFTTDAGGGTVGLFAIDAESGTVLWSSQVTEPGTLPSSVSGVQNGIVFVEGNNASAKTTWISAVDSKSHKELWRQEGGKTGPDVVYVPASGNKVFFGTEVNSDASTGLIQVYDAVTGAKGWSVNVTSVNFFPDSAGTFAIGSGNLIYAGDQVYGLNATTGKQSWAWPPPDYDNPGGWPAISPDGKLVVFTTSTHVYALDTKTGQQKWMTAKSAQSKGLDSMETGTPQIADGNVYVLEALDNIIWALDANTGATRWKYACPTEPQWIAGGGYVYAACGTSLIAIKASGQ